MSYPLLRLGGLLLLMSCVACSPSRKIQRYTYLIDEPRRQPSKPDVKQAAPSTLGKAEKAKSLPPKVGKASHPAGSLSSSQKKTVVKTALAYVGTPYQYGGMSRKGMDCSGLMCTAYQAIDRKLPRRAIDMSKMGREVSLSEVQPGHLVFFDAKHAGRISHVGMVVSVHKQEIMFVHASSSKGVREDNLYDSYWRPRFRKAVAP